MNTYLAFLRGVNVGGKAMIKMAELVTKLEAAGFNNVRTYIQSGNVLIDSKQTDKKAIASVIKSCLDTDFNLQVEVAIFTAAEWQSTIKAAPAWWGANPDWKHNILILTETIPMDEVLGAIGELKPEIENIAPGTGVVFQSVSFKMFGRTTSGKLASNPIYKKMTVRNYNTAAKLAKLLN